MALTLERVRKAAAVLRCISHPDRLRIVECLRSKELSVSELMRKLKLPQAVVSKHLSALRAGKIVGSRTRANFRLYTVIYPNVLSVLDCIKIHGGK